MLHPSPRALLYFFIRVQLRLRRVRPSPPSSSVRVPIAPEPVHTITISDDLKLLAPAEEAAAKGDKRADASKGRHDLLQVRQRHAASPAAGTALMMPVPNS